MKVTLLGSSSFAVPSLAALLENETIHLTGVVTQQDRPKGRGHRVQPTPVKSFALQHSLPVYQPESIRSEEARQCIQHQGPDLIVVIAYGQILPAWLLELPSFGAINVHASLLPKYRGAAPVQRALLEGETLTGVTIIQMDAGLDSGAILLQESMVISPTETAGELHNRLAILGAKLLLEALQQLEEGTLRSTEQESSRATRAPKISRESGRVDWRASARSIHNRIRAMNPWPGCTCSFRGKRLKIWRSNLSGKPADTKRPTPPRPGLLHVGLKGRLTVECGDGELLEILEVNLPGRNRISAAEFVNGSRIREGELLECPSP